MALKTSAAGWRIGLIGVCAATLCWTASPTRAGGDEGPPLPDLLSQAGQYAQLYAKEFSQVTAEETWVQKAFKHRNQCLLDQRRLQSDLVFMNAGGELIWMT